LSDTFIVLGPPDIEASMSIANTQTLSATLIKRGKPHQVEGRDVRNKEFSEENFREPLHNESHFQLESALIFAIII